MIHKITSKILTHDITNGGIRAMLYGNGLTKEDFNKPL